MNDQQPSHVPNSSGALIDHAARTDEDELVLGWECANPALQIERWRQDVAAALAAMSSNS
ncbi:MAG: hypothetical protein ABI409_20015 [Ramlibacter sp.]